MKYMIKLLFVIVMWSLCVSCSNREIIIDNEEIYEESIPSNPMDIPRDEEENKLDYEI